MKHTSDHAATAKAIRAELKRNNIPARVRSSAYAGGSSVDVDILADVAPATKREIRRFCSQFVSGYFDGMQDLYIYTNKTENPTVSFVFVDVKYSDEIKQRAWDYIRSRYAGFEDAPEDFREAGRFCPKTGSHSDYGDRMIWSTLLGQAGDGFWSTDNSRGKTA